MEVFGLSHVPRQPESGIGVLISDHNVEQTLDIVDRAYIMFDGQVKVSGTVKELVFDDTVARSRLSNAVDKMNQKFGKNSVFLASLDRVKDGR